MTTEHLTGEAHRQFEEMWAVVKKADALRDAAEGIEWSLSLDALGRYDFSHAAQRIAAAHAELQAAIAAYHAKGK